MRINIRNNGRFDVGGYFIHATNSSDQELATIDLSKNLVYGTVSKNAVSFIPSIGGEFKNYLKPNDERPAVFNSLSNLSSIELIPIRYQVMDNKKQLVSCRNAKIIENLDCGPLVVEGECVPVCGECGSDGCGVDCGICAGDDDCVNGLCVEVETCIDDSDCSGTEVCVSNVCQLCGNGFWVADGEECDDGNTVSGDGCSSICELESASGYDCSGEPTICVYVG